MPKYWAIYCIGSNSIAGWYDSEEKANSHFEASKKYRGSCDIFDDEKKIVYGHMYCSDTFKPIARGDYSDTTKVMVSIETESKVSIQDDFWLRNVKKNDPLFVDLMNAVISRFRELKIKVAFNYISAPEMLEESDVNILNSKGK